MPLAGQIAVVYSDTRKFRMEKDEFLRQAIEGLQFANKAGRTVSSACVHWCEIFHGISYHADGTGTQEEGSLISKWFNAGRGSKRRWPTEKQVERILRGMEDRCAQILAIVSMPRCGRWMRFADL